LISATVNKVPIKSTQGGESNQLFVHVPSASVLQVRRRASSAVSDVPAASPAPDAGSAEAAAAAAGAGAGVVSSAGESLRGGASGAATDAAALALAASLKGLSAERAGVASAASWADLAFPREELSQWLLPLAFSPLATAVPKATAVPEAIFMDSSFSPSPITASAAPSKRAAATGFVVTKNSDESQHVSLTDSPSRASFTGTAMETFSLVDDHYAAPPATTAAAEMGLLSEFRGQSLHLGFTGEADVRAHFLRFFVFIFQVRR
jgi:hypothetical protein